MPTPSGTISMSDVNSALGRSSTASINFNDSLVRFLADNQSGSVSMSTMRGRYFYSGTITPTTLVDGKTYQVYGRGYASNDPSCHITGTIGGQTINVFYTGAQLLNLVIYLNASPAPFTTSARVYVPGSNNSAYQTLPYNFYYTPGWYNTSGNVFTDVQSSYTFNWYFSN